MSSHLLGASATDDESNGFVIVEGKKKQGALDPTNPSLATSKENQSEKGKAKASTADAPESNSKSAHSGAHVANQGHISKKTLKNTSRINEPNQEKSLSHNRGDLV